MDGSQRTGLSQKLHAYGGKERGRGGEGKSGKVILNKMFGLTS